MRRGAARPGTDMKYLLIIGLALAVTGCGTSFSINNPNPYSTYTYDTSDCCRQGNMPRL